ncbi:MAG TPA: TIGR03435 family protein [Acidobacteriaceae bacterium]|jgi:uncharacterized protein (TIGR03435 family)
MIGKICATILLSVGVAMGQAASPEPAKPAKSMAFEVASIRQNTTPMDQRMGPPQFGPTPDGYRLANMPLAMVIMTAYPASEGGGALLTPDRISGLPDWGMQDRYDIVAKVAEEDLPEWQKPAKQTEMLQAMLQTLLADRCKIKVHRDSKELPVYMLTVGKNGPKFKESDPAEQHAPGMTLPGGATMVPSQNGGMSMYGTSMGMLATLLSSMGRVGRPVQDKTGLTGKYDITIQRPDMGGGGGAAVDPTDMVFTVVNALGLKLEPSKASVETLVVDHIEKPSEN